jgi:hypothetical protein
MVWVVRGDTSCAGNQDSLTNVLAEMASGFNSRAGHEMANAHRDKREINDATVGVPPNRALRTAGLDVDGLVAVIITATDTPDHPFYSGVEHFVAAEWVFHF